MEKKNTFWNTLEKLYVFLGVIEYNLIRILGWIFLIIGISNLIKSIHFYLIEEDQNILLENNDTIIFLKNELSFVFIPIFIGGFLLLVYNQLKLNKNE
jgi:hypothetical protein